MPKVSVLMPIRNAERTVKESVKSILTQSFRDFEFLICDDASKDETDKILRSFRDRRMYVVKNGKKIGVAASLNRLLNLARSEFICRMDADDIAKKDRLKIQMEFLQKHPGVGLAGSWFQEIDEHGQKQRIVKFPIRHHEIRKSLPRFNPIRHPTLMARRLVVKQLNGYDEVLEGAEDYDLVIRASTITRLANIPRSLLTYRIHSTSVSVAETKRILWRAILARWKALRHGYFYWWEGIFLIKPLLSFVIPISIKRWVERVLQ